jgi:hypothetical protein
MDWTFDKLFNKAKIYVQRAFDANGHDDSLVPFWATIGLEFLGRAVLAKINPALVADPQVGENLLYAAGFTSIKAPKSIMAKTVFARCETIIDDFTKADFAFVMSLVERRNEELHSGGLPFEDFKTSEWQTDYYRVSEILLKHAELGLPDLFGEEEAKIAEKLIDAANTELMATVKKKLGALQTLAKEWDEKEREEKTKAARALGQTIWTGVRKEQNCPACGSPCYITGEVIRTSDPYLDEDQIVTEKTYLPNRLICGGCGLELKGLASLRIAGADAQFKMLEYTDARDYYMSDFDPAEYYGGEYNNS